MRTNTLLQSTAVLGAAPWDLSAGWYGRMFEVIVIQGDISAADRDAMERYLATKWRIVQSPSNR
jgi:hypothetical protein